MTESFLIPSSDTTLVNQIVGWYASRIDDRIMRSGTRLPSIRQFAALHHVSKFTVVEAYDRLIARSYIESRRGAGFFVRERSLGASTGQVHAWAEVPRSNIDVVWLLRNMFKKLPARDMPGGGVLPADWLDEDLITQSLRALGRQSGAVYLDYGHPQGYLPLRQQLQLKLAELEIHAPPEQIVTTIGVTQGLALIAQQVLQPGDTVLVDEPSWFLIFGRLAQLGVRIIGVPRHVEGPDLVKLRELAIQYRPKMYVVMSVLHNPTSTSMTAGHAFQVLRIAEEFDFLLIEDDVYCDLHPGPSLQPCIRLATLDQLKRVVYLGGFSKTLAANLRVGFMAGPPALIQRITDLKMLVGLTSPEFGERIVYRVLSEGHYRRHLERLRGRLNQVREATLRELDRLGLKLFAAPAVGMFVWADTGIDTNPLAQSMLDAGYLLAPGSLFLPDQRPSSWLRFNVATSRNPRMLERLAVALDRAPGRGRASAAAQ